ncbi:NADH dehydrogenase subunit 2 (mitochondrion) [Callorhinchus milii]|uniref:NADH-ubiquinone oxidoreductase chain 2 n=1 Tax=Callorhinchus milii TaxID=7868 RepID=D7RWS8_CALMI|nr:NADH dehydrogenase subunit 2 [Callorhinchus milii]ADI57828.1 NADH dehydrogenase subunit 2 [Callorhinchus milii]|eukprot:gi/299829035/ref/YP_003734925.1/ NADH dehydrogenase subunit 2 (mitochondrion) [Callorhinchus milii]
MNPLTLSIFIMSLGLGTTITFSSSHWLLAWMGLEINTLAITPLMIKQQHPRAVEATTKYFLTQAAASALLLFASMTNAWMTGQWSILEMENMTAITLITLALALKLGVAPMHFWLPEVLQGLDLKTGLILSTWQKLAPFIILIQMAPALNPNIMISLAIISTLIGGWGGLNQTQLRKILAYSSIAHLGWMIIILHYSPNIAMLNLVLYLVITSTIFLLFNLTNSTTINSISMTTTKNPIISILIMMTLLSLGGLPPLTGFMPKWLILQELAYQELFLVATIMAMTTLLSLFFYLRLTYSTTLTMTPNSMNMMSSWLTKKNLKPIIPLLFPLTTMLLPLTPMLYFSLQ